VKTPEPPKPARPQTSESVRKRRDEEARIAAAKKKLEGVNLDDPIYGNNGPEHKLRFSSIGYEIVDAEVVPQSTVKKVTVTKTVQGPKVYSEYKWPYQDSYIPKVKMLEKDA